MTDTCPKCKAAWIGWKGRWECGSWPAGHGFEGRVSETCWKRQIAQRDERNAALEARALRMEKALQAVNEHLVSAVALLMVPGEPLSEWAEGRALVLKAQDALANAVLREETDHG